MEQYKQIIHSDKSIGLFVRELGGLERGAAKETFAGYLDESKFNAQQIQFMNTILPDSKRRNESSTVSKAPHSMSNILKV
ncbi:MAG: hypothetical protein ACJASL_002681 [Paraglaciecola sp.]